MLLLPWNLPLSAPFVRLALAWTSFVYFFSTLNYLFLIFYYPISTLPEHLHSTFPSYAKLPENTLTEKKNIPFPSLTLITCLTGPPVTPPPFTGRPSHTLSYTTILFLALKVNGRFLESLPVLRLLRLSLSCRCLFSLTFTSR